MSDIDTALVDSLKALDPKRPIREARHSHRSKNTQLFDHLVGAGEHGRRNGKPECLGILRLSTVTACA